MNSCYVRARRLNVIIQPHLRFTYASPCPYSPAKTKKLTMVPHCSYELLKWEESQLQKRKRRLRRELEWPTIARDISLMNKPYSRQQ
jgi:dual specificity MAP kinase phosphatase